ncbi:hypothetical protein BDN72DRAFT_579759 [Pluteus cervinus]|uniref:Uncharacterized protein n=1 Tax=Pluteus cervinus TaxID=181527 RepID=A0ACD3AW33_9AGAR|nr:hypothetical protein BDN72DRAFT_579759 [Pluteus cervinus]
MLLSTVKSFKSQFNSTCKPDSNFPGTHAVDVLPHDRTSRSLTSLVVRTPSSPSRHPGFLLPQNQQFVPAQPNLVGTHRWPGGILVLVYTARDTIIIPLRATLIYGPSNNYHQNSRPCRLDLQYRNATPTST